MPNFDPTEYKLSSKSNWNVVAPDYHHNWANGCVGPFGSTAELIRIAEIRPSDKVLDLACGTGAVSKHAAEILGKEGYIFGVDFSRTALSIARGFVSSKNANFFEMDAENLGFQYRFDRVLCQYGIMFFPNVNKVLKTVKNMLKPEGKMVLAVHGNAEEVPYFSSIMKPILRHMPDIRPEGAPTVHRFGNPSDLARELRSAGFVDVVIKSFKFTYEPGTFAEYWNDYMHSTANSIRPKIESMGREIISSIRDDSERNVSPYIREGIVVFPWIVHILSAC
ncbi:MAG TPA: methyltransferase domain-containing protein [Candidatus Nitrosotalea sp.]|nr:methyltransferase domain-containing protein [Candidatus Nitrosotalea sp.]